MVSTSTEHSVKLDQEDVRAFVEIMTMPKSWSAWNDSDKKTEVRDRIISFAKQYSKHLDKNFPVRSEDDLENAKNYNSGISYLKYAIMDKIIVDANNPIYLTPTLHKAILTMFPDISYDDVTNWVLDLLQRTVKVVKGPNRMERIKVLLADKLNCDKDTIAVIINTDSGANNCFIAQIGKKKYYVKSSSDDVTLESGSLVDPRELFLYKLLEYTGFGPKTFFLLQYQSSGSSTTKTNFIVTQDCEYSKSQLKKRPSTWT